MASTKPVLCLLFLCCLHQALGAGVTQCYFCLDDTCDGDVAVQNCTDLGEGDYSCIVMYDPGTGDDAGSQARGCINDADTNLIEACDLIDQGENSTCTICEQDLCNTNRTVRQCYACQGACEGALQVQQCPPGVEHVCLSARADAGVTKGCLPKTHQLQEVCQAMNEQQEGACQVCQQDLCNL